MFARILGKYECTITALTEKESKGELVLSLSAEIDPKDVKEIIISTRENEPSLYRIPTELFFAFPNLSNLIINSEIEEISAQDFVNAAKLKRLELGSNRLRKLSRASIERPFNSDNWLALHFQDNEIETIEDLTFVNQPHLNQLDLGGNRLTVIKRNTFAGLSRLHNLKLWENGIHTIEEGAFADLSNLKLLYLDHNEIKVLNDHTFIGLTDLRVLSLGHNHINIIADSMASLTSVEEIRLDFNKIHDLNLLKFSELPALRKLNLKASIVSLEHVDANSLSPSNSKLTYLDISTNNLTDEVSLEVLRVFPNLTEVNISGNDYNRLSVKWQHIQNSYPNIYFY